MIVTTAYYPEYFDPAQWKRDFALIRDMGATAVRFAEFAWSLMEPSEGEFHFEWLDDAISLCEKYGLKVILCTPTAAPPVWLTEKYPDALPVNIHGRRSLHGSRQQRCYHSKHYLERSRIITEEMARRYGSHPSVIAWQIDNELGGEMKKCFCDNCKRAFQKRLQEKYKDISDLNRRWGNRFWSQEYSRFDQIPVPMHFGSDMHIWHNPSLNLEFLRFSSDSIIDFARMQADILRRYTKATVTTNQDTFYWGDNVDIQKMFSFLDVGGMDVYSEDDSVVGFYSDITRSVKGDSFWMLEYGDGFESLTDKMTLCEKKGCTLFEIFKFRPFPWGQEQSLRSLLEITGEPAPNYKKVQSYLSSHAPAKREKAQIALNYHYDSSWAHLAKSLMLDVRDGLTYPAYLENCVYRALFEMDQPVDFTFDLKNLSSYKIVITLRHILYDEETEKSLISYVENGGILIADTELFLKNSDNVYRETIAEIYPTVFAHTENRCLTDKDIESARITKFGKGTACMIKADADKEDIKALIARFL